ncbi:MAG: efflux RND transporter permease subunit [Bacteroidia bacterium]
MRSIISYFVKYPVAGNVILITILIFGLLGMVSLRTDFFPDSENRNITVQLTYPGASPEEMEEGVILKIEDNLKGITGIERITSKASENTGNINVEGELDYDMEKLLTDVKNAIDRIPSFPVDLEPPVIFRQESRNLAIGFSLSGDVPLKTLKTKAREVEADLLAIDGISKVDISGYPDEEIEIAVREMDMRAYRLTFADVRDAVRNANLELTGGSIKTEDEELLIRSRNKEYSGKELRDIIVTTAPDGRAVRLWEVAEVRDRWADSPNRAYLDGAPSVALNISNTNSEDVLFITETVKDYLKDFNETEEIIKGTVTADFSVSLTQRRDLLVKNGFIGFIMVIFFLAIFLNIRLAFWVALAIPVCFAGMFAIGAIFGLTINVISLFGMIIVIGILVDDGIVISENIYQHWERGKSRLDAAIDGTLEVLPAITAAILTTVAAFSAFYFLDGRTGEIFSEMSFVVILTLIFSLVEGAFILPGHVGESHALDRDGKDKKGFDRVMSRVEGGSNRLMGYLRNRVYAPILRIGIRYPLIMISIPITLLVIGVGGIRGGFVGTTFFPFIDSNDLSITLKMPAGTREAETEKWLMYIEEKAREVNAEIAKERPDGLEVLERYSRRIGPSASDGTVSIRLADGDNRNMPNIAISSRLRKAIGRIDEAEQLTLGGRTFFGKPVSIAMMGNDLGQLEGAVEELKQKIGEMSEVKDVTDNNLSGLRELNVELKEKARFLGLNLQTVVSQVRQGFFGYEVQRLQRGEDEVRVWVRYDERDRASIGQLENMRIRLPDGREFPLKELATLSEKRGIVAINRIDGMREIRIEGDLATFGSSASDVNATIKSDILPEILAKYSGVRASFEGQARSAQQTQESGTRVMIIIVFIMYLMTVLTFRSWGQALLVIPLLLPFGLIGVIYGHWIHDQQISILSGLGIIALWGIMINDSLVLISQFNLLIKQGRPFVEALYEASLSRFRAILLTSLTTVAGLYPLILETSFQARFLVPMAISVAWGLIFATFVILVTIPSLLVLANNYRTALAWLWYGKKIDPTTVEPALRGRLPLAWLWEYPLYVIAGFAALSFIDFSPENSSVIKTIYWGSALLIYAIIWITRFIGSVRKGDNAPA